MTNDFYNNGSNTVAYGGIAKATDIEAKFDEVVTGFDKLPGETELNRGTVNFVDAGGTANTYTATLHQTAASYVDDMEVVFRVPAANTGACTLNVDGLGAKAIKNHDGDSLSSNALPADSFCHVRYDADNDYFVVMGTSYHEDRIRDLEVSVNSALVAGSGCPVSNTDSTGGFLYGTDGTDGKVRVGEGLNITRGNAGGDEYVTLSCEDASDSNKGVASFSADNFSVSAGVVTIPDATNSIKGVASFAENDFSISAGAVSLQRDHCSISFFNAIAF